jgi:hypothetical protein
VDAGTGIITTVAGNGARGFSGDGGPATSASLSSVFDVVVDASGNLFISDNRRVRFVDGATGIISTYAGGSNTFCLPTSSCGDGGPATGARIAPVGIALDSAGNLYIVDNFSPRLRRVDATPPHIITTVAGTGLDIFSGDGGLATLANLIVPLGVGVDNAGNIFVSDQGSNRVRRIDAATKIITTVAGGGSVGDGRRANTVILDGSISIAVDTSGKLFIASLFDSFVWTVDARTRKIATMAGNGVSCDVFTLGFSFCGLNGGLAASAGLNSPSAIATDNFGNLYILNLSGIVLRVDAVTGTITVVAGGGFPVSGNGDGGPALDARVQEAQALAVDTNGNIYIGEQFTGRVRRVDAVTHIITLSLALEPSDSAATVDPQPVHS